MFMPRGQWQVMSVSMSINDNLNVTMSMLWLQDFREADANFVAYFVGGLSGVRPRVFAVVRNKREVAILIMILLIIIINNNNMATSHLIRPLKK
jgi:hypothetical protein